MFKLVGSTSLHPRTKRGQSASRIRNSRGEPRSLFWQLVKDLVQHAERLSRLEEAREALVDNVKARFGAMPDDICAAIQAITDVERLRRLRPVTVLESLDKIRDELK